MRRYHGTVYEAVTTVCYGKPQNNYEAQKILIKWQKCKNSKTKMQQQKKSFMQICITHDTTNIK